MSANRFRFALAYALGSALGGAGLSMALQLRVIWAGPLIVSGLIMTVAALVPERGRTQ